MKVPDFVRNITSNLTKDVRGILGYYLLPELPNPPIIVVGSQNSGTTIFAKAFSVHRDVKNKSEEALLWDRFHRTDRSDVFKTREDATLLDKLRIRGNFSYFHFAYQTPYVLNKIPHNCLRIHYVKEIIPEAKIIHLIRDGRAAVRSNLHSIRYTTSRQSRPFGGFTRPRDWKKWSDRPYVEQMAHMWNELVTYASKEGRKYGDDYREVFYEELPGNTENIFKRLWDWVGLEVRETYLKKIPTFENRNHQWPKKLTDDEVKTIESIAKEGLKRFDYI